MFNTFIVKLSDENPTLDALIMNKVSSDTCGASNNNSEFSPSAIIWYVLPSNSILTSTWYVGISLSFKMYVLTRKYSPSNISLIC